MHQKDISISALFNLLGLVYFVSGGIAIFWLDAVPLDG